MKSSENGLEIPFGAKTIIANFDGGSISSDAGLMLLRELDRKLGLTGHLAACIDDGRDQSKVKVTIREMLAQRIFGIACGYEDCNDHDCLRSDPMMKLAVDRQPVSGGELASQPTLSRLENSVSAVALMRMCKVLFDGFVARHKDGGAKVIFIDPDATDDPTHGQQEFEFFHGYYDCHCYLPLLVYATVDGGEQELIASVLRRGNAHAGHRLVSVLKRIVPVLKASFPDARIVLRGDAGMAGPDVYDFCEQSGIVYLLSLAKNSRLLEHAEELMRDARAVHEQTGEKVRHFGEFHYAADTWPHKRRVIAKAEIVDKGENPRFVVTNIETQSPADLYETYIERGDVENRIKELKLDLASGRTSCHRFLANQFRLLLHAAAYVLMQELRKLLAGTEFAKSQVSSLRLKLLKVAVRVRQTTRRIWLMLPTSYPLKDVWIRLASDLVGPPI